MSQNKVEVNRRSLQLSLFFVSLVALLVSLIFAGVRFSKVDTAYELFLSTSKIEHCYNGDDDTAKKCKEYANKSGIDIFSPQWKGNLLTVMFENVSKIYLPIIAVMLATLLSGKANSQKIRLDQFIISIFLFLIVHSVSTFIVIQFLLTPALSVGNIPNLLSTTFSTLMGIIVGFSFPESNAIDTNSGDQPK